MMNRAEQFRPNWISPPGETIRELLDELDISVGDFAVKIREPNKTARNLIKGSHPINHEIAQKLSDALGGTTSFWLNRQSQYQEDETRNLQSNRDPQMLDWLKLLPVKDMIKFGWIKRLSGTVDQIEACLQYFNIANEKEWHRKYKYITESSAFRTSPKFKQGFGAVATWIRQGEVQAKAIKCNPWNSGLFESKLIGIKRLTWKKNPNLFVPLLRDTCAECGVALVIVRAPNGCIASGATRFINQKTATIILSFRYLSDDHFWFTFFHEAGHLILHGKNRLFLEGDDLSKSKEEEEANLFASNTLLPAEFLHALHELPIRAKSILEFAKRVGVCPGIIVGQMQHFGLVGPNQLNGLKRRYDWNDINL